MIYFIPLKDMCIIDSTPISETFSVDFFSHICLFWSVFISFFEVCFLFTCCWRKPHIRILWVDDYFPTSVSVGYVWSFPYSTPEPLPFVPQGPMKNGVFLLVVISPKNKGNLSEPTAETVHFFEPLKSHQQHGNGATWPHLSPDHPSPLCWWKKPSRSDRDVERRSASA